jgi:phosphoribosylaminoimidazolecarboxamide formyltransferase/IMP cyclohydrolase
MPTPTTESSSRHGADRLPVRRALLSVSDKTGLIELAQALRSLDITLISTGGTARALREAGLEVVAVDSVTGFPEILDGRVKTLHPRIHGALLARRDDPSHIEAMQAHEILPIDLLVIDLYPFERTVAAPECTLEQAIEQIDIGGPAMIRSAAKNHAFVAVVTSPSQYQRVLGALETDQGCTTLSLRRKLAAEAIARTAAYDTAIAGWMRTRVVDGRRELDAPSFTATLPSASSEVPRGEASQGLTGAAGASAAVAGSAAPAPGAPVPDEGESPLSGSVTRSWSFRSLRYGENPHQRAAIAPDERGDRTSIAGAVALHGREMGYNNLLDAAAALDLTQDLVATFGDEPSAVIVKHTNPCGAAVAPTLARAFSAAHEGDPLAAYGGILALSGEVDAECAEVIAAGEKFFEVIVAPSFAPAALELLGARWKTVRLLPIGPIGAPVPELLLRSIPGGVLIQERDVARPQPDHWTRTAGPAPDTALLRSASFATLVTKHLKSNAICIVHGTTLLGAGAGQMDRVASCRIAVAKAGSRLSSSAAGGGPVPVAASDAFFPFADGPKVLIDAGVRCIVHPGGSRRDAETIALCSLHGVTLLATGTRGFRH